VTPRARKTLLTVAMLVMAGALLFTRRRAHEARQVLLAELRPVALADCVFERLGSPADGGYLACANLLDGAQGAYSYGIAGTDDWGCQVAERLKAPTHEYDCFNTRAPRCAGGELAFHAECVGGRAQTIDGRLFDSVEGQIATNGDAGKRLIVKMDVEGAEYESLLAVSDAQLGRIDQLVIEFHGVNVPEALPLVRRLKQFFHVADLHFNNFTCDSRAGWLSDLSPFPAWAYEVLFVNKRLATPDAARTAAVPNLLSAPNNPALGDCQAPSSRPVTRGRDARDRAVTTGIARHPGTAVGR
jgi:hypothetical protein